jgi:hypothetical protein
MDRSTYLNLVTDRYGTDTTKATCHCLFKVGVMGDTLQPKSLEKIRELEFLPSRAEPPTPEVLEAPKFITQIQELSRIIESQSAHFEAKLTPTNDPNLKVGVTIYE